MSYQPSLVASVILSFFRSCVLPFFLACSPGFFSFLSLASFRVWRIKASVRVLHHLQGKGAWSIAFLLACLLAFFGPLPRERNGAKDKNEINSKNKKKRETKKTKKWRIILCLKICYVVSFGLRPPVCTQEREQFGAKGKFVGQDGFPLPPHVPFYPKLFFACFLADGKGIRKRH